MSGETPIDDPRLAATLGRVRFVATWDYIREHPYHLLVLDGGICVDRDGLPMLVWEGDLDLTLHEQELVAFAKGIGETIYILDDWNLPGSFDGAPGEALSRAVTVIEPNGTVSISEPHIRRDEEGRPRYDQDAIRLAGLSKYVELLQRRCERLEAIVRRGVEQGWVTGEERDRLRLPETKQ